MFILQDVRLALRLLRRAPSFTAIALLSIALSVAATAVVFAAVKTVLIAPLPYARPGELVQIRTGFAASGASSLVDWAFWNDAHEVIRRTRTLASVGIYRNAIFDLAGNGAVPPEALYGLRVSANLFPTLGVTPILGRNILPEEEKLGQPEVMILSYGLWVRRFNSDRNVVSRSASINSHECRIIGVMAPDFNFPLRRAAAHTPSPYVEFWAPLREDATQSSGAMGAVARLGPGVSLSQAQQDIASIGAALSRELPATNRDHTLGLGFLRERTLGNAESALWFLMAAAVLFLLIGCANVANLLLARGMVRQREMAIRISLGAGMARIVRQLLTESLVLALLGGMGGYLLTAAAWKVLPAIAPVNIPRLAAARADWWILAFSLGIALVSGLLFGMAPALRAYSANVSAVQDLRSTGKGNRLRGWLVVAEVAVTVTLVMVGGQLLGKFIALLESDPGFQADHILASVVIPALERYPTPQDHAAIYRRFLQAVRNLPGVESAGTVNALPFSGENDGGLVTTSQAAINDLKSQLVAEIDTVSSDYLPAMGVHLLAGRQFREEEMKADSDVAIVNDVAARRLWPDESALAMDIAPQRAIEIIDRRICVLCTPEKPDNWKRVIGVVGSVRHATMEGPDQPSVYLADEALERAAFIVARTSRSPDDLSRAIRAAIAGVDPNQPVFLSVPMRTLIADSLADRRFIMSLLAITAGLALLMSMAGVYGVTSYTTSRRTHEIGIRIALGATPGNVISLIFRQGFITAALGLVIGVSLTLALIRVIRSMLAGMESGNLAYASLAIVLVSVTAAAACWIPARRAARVDPMDALRAE